MADWFYQHRGEAIGPVEGSEIASMLDSGAIGDTTLIRSAASDKWMEAWEVDHAKLMSATLDDRHEEGYVTPATAWRRIVAYVLDAFIINILATVSAYALGIFDGAEGDFGEQMTTSFLFALMVSCLYYGATIGSHLQATVGKRAMGLRVIRTTGAPVGYIRGGMRPILYLVSGIPLLIGFIMAFFHNERATLHDHILGTRMILVDH
ncbi:MAG: RDD family protein [Alphaproteobacteria bacterium]|nr:RDD family protein [Alphaproteobacteria bacterium SS10]